MRPPEFIAALRKGKLAPAFFLRGPDRFLHEDCRAALVNSIPAEARAWCLAEIEFKPGRLARELDGARQVPMLGGRNLLVFSDPEDFDHASDDDFEALKAYLEGPAPFATVVFVAAEPDRRRRFIQLLEKKAEVVEMLPLTRRDAAAWIKDFLGRQGVEIDPALAEEIAARFETTREPRRDAAPAGINLLWARTELEKLLTAKPGAKRLEREDLGLLVGFQEEHVFGKLLRAVAERNFGRALDELRALLASKESEMLVLWTISDLFRQALKATAAAADLRPQKGFGPQAGRGGDWSRWANPFSPQEIARDLVRTYTYRELLQAIRSIRQADLRIKSSWKDSKMILEFLLWQIIAGKTSESVPAFELPAAEA